MIEKRTPTEHSNSSEATTERERGKTRQNGGFQKFQKVYQKAMNISILRPIDWKKKPHVVQHWSQKVHKAANLHVRFGQVVTLENQHSPRIGSLFVIVTVVMMVTVMMILGVDTYLSSIVLTRVLTVFGHPD